MNSFQLHDVALFAVIAACWRQIRTFVSRVTALWTRTTTLRGNVALAVEQLLQREARVFRWGGDMILSEKAWIRPIETYGDVAFRMGSGDDCLAVWRGVPVLFRRPKEGGNNPGADLMPTLDSSLVVKSLRGTLDVDALVIAALEPWLRKELKPGRYRIHHMAGTRRDPVGERSDQGPVPVISDPVHDLSSRALIRWTGDDIGARTSPDPFRGYALGPETSSVRDDFRKWLDLKDWYAERNIPWRRGALLHGRPGTGKTALVRALAQEADVPVFSFDLSSMTNQDLRRCWGSAMGCSPCIVLMEDIDGVFHGRDNVLKGEMGGDHLTFDCLLNVIGGVEAADGVYLVVTTNDISKLDPALGVPGESGSSRPGRIDMCFEVVLPSEDQIKAIVDRICGEGGGPDVGSLAGMTAAQVTERAVQEALRDIWAS